MAWRARTHHVFDLIIGGGGTAGLAALKEARKHSANVLLIHASSFYHDWLKMEDAGIRGCEMMAPHGEHLAHLVVFALEHKLTAEEMLAMPYYHPSFEEGLKTALEQLCKKLK